MFHSTAVRRHPNRFVNPYRSTTELRATLATPYACATPFYWLDSTSNRSGDEVNAGYLDRRYRRSRGLRIV